MSVTQPIIHDPNGYEAVVAELRRIADALETVPPGFGPSYVSFTIHAGRSFDLAAVDAVALAVLGKKGAPRNVGAGKCHHHASSAFTPVNISIYQQIPETHYLEPGVDGDDDDLMACGLAFRDAVKDGEFSGRPEQVTCPACRSSALIDEAV